MDKAIDHKRLQTIVDAANQQYSRFVTEEIPEPKRVVEWMGKTRKPRILVLYTGGTLGMKKEMDPKLGEVLVPKLSLDQLLTAADTITGLRNDFDVLGYHVSHIDSTEINTTVWDNLAGLIETHYEEVDGVVVLHGTDTLAYTSAALSFTLRNLAIPVVCTGAQKIMQVGGTDVISNLTGAFEAARSDLAGVAVYFGGDLFEGTRVDKRHDNELAGFHSPIYDRIGKLGDGIELGPRALTRGRHTPSSLLYDPGYANSVVEIVLSPLSAPGIVADAVKSKDCRALVIRSYGPGNIPRWYNPIIEYLTKEAGFPVFISSQCAGSGISSGSDYAVGAAARIAGGIALGDMSSPAAAVKAMKVMNNHDNVTRIAHEMVNVAYAREITLGTDINRRQIE